MVLVEDSLRLTKIGSHEGIYRVIVDKDGALRHVIKPVEEFHGATLGEIQINIQTPMTLVVIRTLPQPFSPTMTQSCPGSTVNDKFRATGFAGSEGYANDTFLEDVKSVCDARINAYLNSIFIPASLELLSDETIGYSKCPSFI